MTNSGSIKGFGSGISPLNVEEKPLVIFGVLTDVQYANCENRPAIYDPNKVRFYRGALKHVDEAFDYWNTGPQKVDFVLQLGDVIDGLNHEFGESESALQKTLATFEKHHALIPTFHTVGNHELYNFDRKQLHQLFYNSKTRTHILPDFSKTVFDFTVPNPMLYYKFSPNPNVKCISLDCFDISVLGYDKAHPSYQEAANLLTCKHGHSDFDGWDSHGILSGLDVRFQQMNGAIGKAQMKWLQEELTESDKLDQHVIVFGHVCLHPDSACWDCLLWNFDEIINIFHQHKCLVAYFSGHSHVSGHAIDSHGISYFVLNSIVETPPNTSSCATVSLYRNRILVSGRGIERSYNIPLVNH